MDSRDGRVCIEYVEGGLDGHGMRFEWKLWLSGPRCHVQTYISNRQLRQLADLVDQVLPKPKEATLVRVELVQVTKGSRKKRRRILQAAAATVDVDPRERRDQGAYAGRAMRTRFKKVWCGTCATMQFAGESRTVGWTSAPFTFRPSASRWTLRDYEGIVRRQVARPAARRLFGSTRSTRRRRGADEAARAALRPRVDGR